MGTQLAYHGGGQVGTNTIHQHSLDQSGRLKRLKLHIEYNGYIIDTVYIIYDIHDQNIDPWN